MKAAGIKLRDCGRDWIAGWQNTGKNGAAWGESAGNRAVSALRPKHDAYCD
jgi:hypothetical protein